MPKKVKKEPVPDVTEAKEVPNESEVQPSEVLTPEKAPGRKMLRARVSRVCHAFWSKKRLTLPAAGAVLILLLAVVPLTRYGLLGLFIKQNVSVTVLDNQTGTPVSKALVAIDGKNVTTNGSGKASIRASVGYQTITVSKQYYQSYTHTQLVALSAGHNQLSVKLVALGRLVPVKVINKLTGKPVADVTIKASNSESITAADGTALIVSPAAAKDRPVSITAKGYNQLQGNLVVSAQLVSANTFEITPAGKLYFLSNLSGKIDVVKTDLDGSNRQTVLAGTGYELPYNTALLASRDWKYLALYAQRAATGSPELDLIDTSTDTMSNIDRGDATLNLVGWDDDTFIYQVNRNGVPSWQSGQQALKSFNATTNKLTLLAQTTGAGTNQYNYLDQQIGGAYIINNKVVYNLNWQANCYSSAYTGKQATLNAVNADGTGSVVVKSFDVTQLSSCSLSTLGIAPYDEPNSLALAFPSNSNAQYYEYKNGSVSSASDITDQNFYANNYPTYLQSPSGNKTFWSVYADGKNNLSIGDLDGQNPKTIATESDYSPYGWYTDGYVLLQKSGSELYIQASDGSGQPFKVANYYKPQNTYRGYGGGYGGL